MILKIHFRGFSVPRYEKKNPSTLKHGDSIRQMMVKYLVLRSSVSALHLNILGVLHLALPSNFLHVQENRRHRRDYNYDSGWNDDRQRDEVECLRPWYTVFNTRAFR